MSTRTRYLRDAASWTVLGSMLLIFGNAAIRSIR